MVSKNSSVERTTKIAARIFCQEGIYHHRFSAIRVNASASCACRVSSDCNIREAVGACVANNAASIASNGVTADRNIGEAEAPVRVTNAAAVTCRITAYRSVGHCGPTVRSLVDSATLGSFVPAQCHVDQRGLPPVSGLTEKNRSSVPGRRVPVQCALRESDDAVNGDSSP